MLSLSANFGKKSVEIMACQLRHCFRRHVSQFGQQFGYKRNVRRIVGFSSVRNWCQIRTVSLNQKSIQRHPSRHIAQILGRFEGQNTRKRDVVTQIKRCFGHSLSLSKTVKYAPSTVGVPYFALFFQDSNGVI